MKKTLFILIIVGLALTVSSCKRTEVADPSWDGPAGFNVLLEGSVIPALQIIDGRLHYSEVYVRVTNAKGNPLANETVFLELLANSSSSEPINWGYFKENNLSTIQQVTNANGEIKVTLSWPIYFHQEEMWIHALLVIDGRAYRYGNVPEDWISLTMYEAGGAAIGATK
jgi:hypothetical protein